MNMNYLKKCCGCQSICFKLKIHKNRNKEDGLTSFRKIRVKVFFENRIKTDIEFRLIRTQDVEFIMR